MSKSKSNNLWTLDEENSSAGSRVYRKSVEQSVIDALPESRLTFMENRSIIEKIASLILKIAR